MLSSEARRTADAGGEGGAERFLPGPYGSLMRSWMRWPVPTALNAKSRFIPKSGMPWDLEWCSKKALDLHAGIV